MSTLPHKCDEHCRCPEHRTPMIYWPQGDDHACQDVTCEYGHGVYRALAAQENRRAEWLRKDYAALTDEVIAGLSTGDHHKVIRGGLPFCQCGYSLGSGDASGDFITHALGKGVMRAPQPDPAGIPGGLIKFGGELTQEQVTRFRRDWTGDQQRQVLETLLVAGFRAQLELCDPLEEFGQ